MAERHKNQVSASNRKLIVHADNASWHTARISLTLLDENDRRKALYLPYSPDLAPSDFFLFGHVKQLPPEVEFPDPDSLFKAIGQVFTGLGKVTLNYVFFADGSASKSRFQPFAIIGRETCEIELFQPGYTSDLVLYACQENGFITSGFLEPWTQDGLFPYTNETRGRSADNGKTITLLDGSTYHGTGFFLDGCTYKGFVSLFLPPHLSDYMHPLDLGRCGIQKPEAPKVHSSAT